MSYIYFDDLFLHILSIMIVVMSLDLNRKVVLGIAYAMGAMTLLFTSAAIYNVYIVIYVIYIFVMCYIPC
jgi:hypothetical protein